MVLRLVLPLFVALISIAVQAATPTATITAVDASANETPGNTGAFRITFSEANTTATTVAYTIASDSTATNGADYTNLSGTVVMPANATTVDILVTPQEDILAEGPQTVHLALAAGTGYTVSTPNNATVTIEDNEVQEILLSTASLTLYKGEGADVTVTLKYQPEALSTIVNITRLTACKAYISTPTIDFTSTNWNTGEVLGIWAGTDLTLGNGGGTVRVASSVAAQKDITIIVLETLDAARTSLLQRPDAFDAAQFTASEAYRKEYLAKIAPARVNRSAEPANGVAVLRAQGSLRATFLAGSGGSLSVVGAPNAPVTFCSQDEGVFRPLYANCITVQADAAGVATVRFIPSRSGSRSRILVASPLASGQLCFVVLGQ